MPKKRVVKIRNSAGVLNVTIERELALRDVFVGMGDGKLPGMNQPRLEVHKGTVYGEYLITLMDRDSAANKIFEIFLIEGNADDDPRAYIGSFQPEIDSENYVTYEPWEKRNEL